MHGAEETARIQAASAALFGGGDLHGLGSAPGGRPARGGRRPRRPGTGIVDLFVATGLAKSKGEARRTVNEGGAYLNNARVEDVELRPRRTPTSSTAPGWCCGAASGTSPASRSR